MSPDEIKKIMKNWADLQNGRIYIHDFDHYNRMSYVEKYEDDFDEDEQFSAEYFDWLSEPEFEEGKPYQPPEPEEVEEESFFEIILQKHK